LDLAPHKLRYLANATLEGFFNGCNGERGDLQLGNLRGYGPLSGLNDRFLDRDACRFFTNALIYLRSLGLEQVQGDPRVLV